jgi:YidC/Oxa1 family membrane protein insertase
MNIFTTIQDFFTNIYNLLHGMIVSLGVDAESGLSYVLAIVILTIIIKVCLLPFNIKSAHSTRKMQEVQPEVKKIQDKYKSDPQKAQAEVMKLYKEKNVSMFGGCLPSLLPLPILMALYYVFRDLQGINGVSFLWIPDLGSADPYYILPVLSALTTYIPSALMAKASPPVSEGGMNMNGMNIGMSLFMGFMALNFKSLLVIYWILSGMIQLAITYFVNYKPAIAKRNREQDDKIVNSAPKFVMPDYEETNKASKKKKKK